MMVILLLRVTFIKKETKLKKSSSLLREAKQ
jgi:hypothetical protein